jgi:hypothetical protein
MVADISFVEPDRHEVDGSGKVVPVVYIHTGVEDDYYSEADPI